MPVSLSIKNVPDQVADRLRQQAKRNRRSLQGELLAVVEKAAEQAPALSLREVYKRARARGIGSKRNESVEIVRRMRDERTKYLVKLLEPRPRGRR